MEETWQTASRFSSDVHQLKLVSFASSRVQPSRVHSVLKTPHPISWCEHYRQGPDEGYGPHEGARSLTIIEGTGGDLKNN